MAADCEWCEGTGTDEAGNDGYPCQHCDGTGIKQGGS